MKFIRNFNKIKLRRDFIKIVINIGVIIILLFTCLHFFNNRNNTENIAMQNIQETEEDGYSIIDETSELENNTFLTAEETEKYMQDIQETYDNIPVYTDEGGKQYITYESFGTSSDENFDNYQAIYDAHTYANYYGYNVKATLDTYHIYKLEQTNYISIETNTDWNGATFIIHDENINDLETRNSPIFRINSTKTQTTITDKDILSNIEINNETVNIPELAGYGNAMCIVYNEDKMQFIRYGINQNNGKTQRDFFKIDNDGNVLNEIQWNFDNISEIVIIPIPEETITVENGDFVTVLPEENYEQDSGYFYRNIYCTRSNTIIQNINHTVNNTEYIGGPYKGFINLYEVTDVDVKDCYLFSHKYENKSNYDLFLECAVDIKIENVSSNDIEDTQRWGIVGTHYTKDITYENCTLNRIDSHTGVHNLTINNCTIGVKGITVIGSGNLNISNSTILSKNYLIELREDYGSTWNGNIYITNCTYKPINAKQLISFKVSYDDTDTLHDFGYDLYLPNIFIDGLTIDDENSTYTDNQLYMFYNNETYTGVSNGDITGIYNLPEKIYLTNYETTSGRNIKLFYNEFYENLEDTGIQFSIPLSYKKEIQIVDSHEEEIDSDIVTNDSITIKYEKVEGIQTQILINGYEMENTETTLSDSGNYIIQANYSNYEGQVEEKRINITIDKTAPVISGVENGTTYSDSVTPQISDENLAEVQLTLNGEIVEGYKAGDEITEEGEYTLVAKDGAGNETTITFTIEYEDVELEIDSKTYQIDGQYIIQVNQNTTLTEFTEILNANVEYNVYRDEETLENEKIVATGDKLETEYGEIYYIIVRGDINKDGITNIIDLIKMRRNILGLEEFDEFQKIAGDLAEDDIINIKDLVIIRRILLGIEA